MSLSQPCAVRRGPVPRCWTGVLPGRTWRPNLSDPADDHVLELAIAGGVEHLVTHNIHDFGRGELKFTSPRVVTPAQHLKAIR